MEHSIKIAKQLTVTICLFFLLLFILIYSHPVSGFQYGDLNNDGLINIQDVVLAKQHTLGLEILVDKQKLAADVNADNSIDIRDVTLIMQKALGLRTSFPLGQQHIKEFITAEGLSPGKTLVIVIIDDDDPEQYDVRVGGEILAYNNSIEGFMGEIDEKYAYYENSMITKQ